LGFLSWQRVTEVGSAVGKLLFLGIMVFLLAPIALVGFGVQREPIVPSGSKTSHSDVR